MIIKEIAKHNLTHYHTLRYTLVYTHDVYKSKHHYDCSLTLSGYLELPQTYVYAYQYITQVHSVFQSCAMTQWQHIRF